MSNGIGSNRVVTRFMDGSESDLDKARGVIGSLSQADKAAIAREIIQSLSAEERARLTRELLGMNGVQVIFCGSNHTTADLVIQIQQSEKLDVSEILRAAASRIENQSKGS